MTQMLLFDCPTISTVPVVTPSRETQTRREARSEHVAAQAPAASQATGSLPLYDPQQGELHRVGDLAQLVLARYELVQRRRAARRRRQACVAG